MSVGGDDGPDGGGEEREFEGGEDVGEAGDAGAAEGTEGELGAVVDEGPAENKAEEEEGDAGGEGGVALEGDGGERGWLR